MKIQKLYLIIAILLIISIFASVEVSGAQWVYGSLHQHTGFSTGWGYDGNPLTPNDDCQPRAFEGHLWGGKTVSELANEAENELGLSWLGFSDHSYCLDSSEFNTVKSDCQNAQDSGFTCLWGENEK